MKIFDRYLLQQFLTTFTLVVLALPFLFLITDLTEQLDKYMAVGLSPSAVAISYLYYMPQLIFWGLPVAALVSTVFTVSNMTRHQEITAAKAGGVSFYRLTAPLILLGIVLSAVTVVIGEVVPVTNERRAELLGERERVTSPYRGSFVFRTEDGRTLTASRLNALDHQMGQLVLEGRSEDGRVRILHSASSAQWTQREGWTLADGYVRWSTDDGEDDTLHFGALRLNTLKERPEELLVMPKKAEEMRYRELERFIQTIDRSGGDSREYRVNLAQKLSLPVALFVIVLFGAPLATTSKRGGAAFGVGISLAVTMVYLMLFRVGEAVGASGAIGPNFAAWAPNGLFLLAGLVLYARVRT